MKCLIMEVYKCGIYIGFDLCYLIGFILYYFKDWDVDFVVWCNYKYLNVGLGSVVGFYVNSKYFNRLLGLFGWFSFRKDK